jgi:outer membrane protein assembly complex protein YaeT
MRKRQVMVTTVVVSLLGGATLAARTEDPPRVVELASPSVQTDDAPIVDEIAFAGLRRISPQAVRMQLASRAGERLDRQRIAGDVRALARLGWFTTIRVSVEAADRLPGHPEAGPQHVRLVFDLQENPFLTCVEYSGSRLLSQEQIAKLVAEKKLTPKLGEPENPTTMQQIGRAIRAALAELGHPESRVEIRRVQTANATVRERFEIADGPHLPVSRVTFEGDPELSAKLLQRQMRRINPGALFGSLQGKNSYTREALEEDRERLLAYYQNHGYPEARIGDAQVSKYAESSQRWIPWPRKTMDVRLAVRIPIEAGPMYRVESIRTGEYLAQAVAAAHKPPIASTEALPGRPYSARTVENLRRAWQARAQPKARRNQEANFFNVEAIRTLDPNSRSVRILFDRNPTPPYMVGRLEFRGIHHFPDRYFRSRILLKEGAPFDDRLLEAGLARLARTGYFKPIKKEDIHVKTDEASHTADVTIRVEELGQQRAFLTGGRGQFGSTLGIAYTVFNLLDREELLSSHIEGGPESLQLALGFAKEGFLGSRGSLALSAFNTFLRPRLSGSVKGPFFKQESEGVNAAWNYALTNTDTFSVKYDLSHANTQYSPAVSTGVTGLTASSVGTETSSHAAGLGWTRDTGDERITLADSVSGGWLGGSESVLRSKAEWARVMPDPIFHHENSWAFRTSFSGVGSYSGQLPVDARLFAGDEFVRGLRPGELGPGAVVSSVSPGGETKYSATPAGADLVGAANAEYRMHLAAGAEATGFFDVGSGALLLNWLGPSRPTLADSTNEIVHASIGVQLNWTVPGVGVPIRVYYAINVLRLNRWLPMPDGSLFHVQDRFSAFGWGLGSLF